MLPLLVLGASSFTAGRTTYLAARFMSEASAVGALIIKIGLGGGVYYSIVIIRSPPPPKEYRDLVKPLITTSCLQTTLKPSSPLEDFRVQVPTSKTK